MYYLLAAIVYPISYLPFWVLYLMSDCSRWVIFGLIKYRRPMIRKNIGLSFPEKSTTEIDAIIKDFEVSFCDQWFELIKLLTISRKELNERIQCDWSLLTHYKEQGISCNVLLGHQFNWEYSNVICQINTDQKFAGLYLPLKAKSVDRLIYNIRSRMGTILIDASKMKEKVKEIQNETYILGLIADQAPSNLVNARWYNFLNRPCPFMLGPEKGARKTGVAVIYFDSYKVKRGYYQCQMTEICRNAAETPEYFVTDQYVKLLQGSVQRQPSNWLWSHNRWKRKVSETDVIVDL